MSTPVVGDVVNYDGVRTVVCEVVLVHYFLRGKQTSYVWDGETCRLWSESVLDLPAVLTGRVWTLTFDWLRDTYTLTLAHEPEACLCPAVMLLSVGHEAGCKGYTPYEVPR